MCLRLGSLDIRAWDQASRPVLYGNPREARVRKRNETAKPNINININGAGPIMTSQETRNKTSHLVILDTPREASRDCRLPKVSIKRSSALRGKVSASSCLFLVPHWAKVHSMVTQLPPYFWGVLSGSFSSRWESQIPYPTEWCFVWVQKWWE